MVWSDQLARLLFHDSRDALLVCATDGRIVGCNPTSLAYYCADNEAEVLQTHGSIWCGLETAEWPDAVRAAREGKDWLVVRHCVLGENNHFVAQVQLVLLSNDRYLLRTRKLESAVQPADPSPGYPADLMTDIQSEIVMKALHYQQMYIDKERQANSDPLTGLANRRAFERSLATECEAAASRQGEYSIVMLDVDHFKSLNDTFGHAVGDQVLKGLAEILQSSVRSHDTVGRVGGEEFGIVLASASRQVAMEISERIRAKVESATLCERTVTISVGVSTIKGHDVPSAEAVLRADEALYHSKRTGRNRVTHSDDREASVEKSA